MARRNTLEAQSGDGSEAPLVVEANLIATIDTSVETVKPVKRERGMEFAHACIQAGQFRIVVAAVAIISSGAQCARQISVPRGDHSAFAGDQELGGREAEN